MCTNLTRRTFLGAASAGVMAAAAVGQRVYGASAEAALPPVTFSKTRVLRVYLGGGAGWPSPKVNADDEMKRLQQDMDKVPGLEDIEFVGNVRVAEPPELTGVLEKHRDVDGILAVQVSNRTSLLLAVLANSGVPTVVFGVPYSGHEWSILPTIQGMGKKIDNILSSNINDITKAIRPFRAIHRMRETKILYVGGDRPVTDEFIAAAKTKFGTEVKRFDYKILLDAYEKADPNAAKADADLWMKNADKIKEPSAEELVKSSRMYLAMRRVLADEKAQAITINCLGLFDLHLLPAYPCLGFCRLNDIGLAGVCEADMASTMTQLIYQYMEGRPGFVTDPVFDTSNNTVIHAHCVSATKMDGPAGASAPYTIRSHHEDDHGASLQVRMRIGQEVTVAKMVAKRTPAKEMPILAATPVTSVGVDAMLVSTGTIIDTPDVDRGCRTKITTKVRDARKLSEGWYHGLHRVVFYGNLMEDTQRLARLAGFDVIEEG